MAKDFFTTIKEGRTIYRISKEETVSDKKNMEVFPISSQQSSDMLQYGTWTSLEINGLGASPQLYNELIEGEIKKQWEYTE